MKMIPPSELLQLFVKIPQTQPGIKGSELYTYRFSSCLKLEIMFSSKNNLNLIFIHEFLICMSYSLLIEVFKIDFCDVHLL